MEVKEIIMLKQSSLERTEFKEEELAPIKKLDLNDLKEIEEHGNRLILDVKKIKDGGKITLNTADFGYFEKNFIAYLYQKGYDEIEVRFNDTKTFNLIENKLNSLLGFEIISQGLFQLTLIMIHISQIVDNSGIIRTHRERFLIQLFGFLIFFLISKRVPQIDIRIEIFRL